MSAVRGQLRQLALEALLGETIAEQNVFLPRDWPTNSTKMPAISIQTPREQKQSRNGRNGPPVFTTTTWLQLRCQVAGMDPGQVEGQLEQLVNDAELAIMGILIYPSQVFQQILQGEYEMSLSSEGTLHQGEAVLLFGFEYAERFDATPAKPFTGMDITTVAGPNEGPAILLKTLAATLGGNAVLHFAAPLPDTLVAGLYVLERTNPAAIPADTGVQSLDAAAGTVTLTQGAAAAIPIGHTIAFVARVLAETDLDLPSS